MSGSLWTAELAAFDVETTGLAAGVDRVIEIAVVRGPPGGPVRRWSTLVDPGVPVPNAHIHGITDAMLAGQRPFAAVLPALAEALDGAVPVAHNAPFDIAFLEQEHRRAQAPPPRLVAIDTLGLARRCFGLPSNALSALCAHFAIPRVRAHRAEDDAEATLALAWAMFDTLDPHRALTVSGAIDLCRRRSPEELRAVYEALLVAQRAARTVAIDYYAGDAAGSARTRRTIRPLKVGMRRVVAWCDLRGAERTFRLDRMALVSEG